MARGVRNLAVAAAALIVAGCQTATPYQPSVDNAPGYSDERLGPTRYRVTFVGNSATPRRTVENYLLLRSAEVALHAGYQWFDFDTRETRADTRYRTDFMGYPGWGPPFGFGWYWHNWDYGSAYTTPITRYDAYAEIVLLTPEQAKSEPRALNANDIIANIGPRAQRPTSEAESRY